MNSCSVAGLTCSIRPFVTCLRSQLLECTLIDRSLLVVSGKFLLKWRRCLNSPEMNTLLNLDVEPGRIGGES